MRKWLAWKLMQLSRRFNDCVYREQVTVSQDGEALYRLEIKGDTYGMGIIVDDRDALAGGMTVQRQVLGPTPNQPA
jgi:hypothetical protein